MGLALIAAVGANGVLGRNNDLLWHLPNDFKFFKETTKGHPIIMGRKTFDSLGKPLPARTNIIVSRQQDLKIEGCLVFQNLEGAIAKAKELDANPFIIGGAEIYKLALEFADAMFLTHVDFKEEGDAYFPPFHTEDWRMETIAKQEVDDRHKFSYEILSYSRK